VGALVAAVQLAISMSNSGGAWDNAKKYIEKATPDSELQGKGSDIHKGKEAKIVTFRCLISFFAISHTIRILYLTILSRCCGRHRWRSIQ